MALSKVTTYNPIEVDEINWVIENIPVVGDIILSPVFQPIPNCSEKWRFMLQFIKDLYFPNVAPRSDLQVLLLKNQPLCIETCNVKLVLVFKYGDVYEFKFGKDSDLPVCIGKENSYLLHSYACPYDIPDLYRYNKLDVNVKLTVSGYRVNYSFCPHPEIDLEENFHDLSRDLERLFEDTTSADITFLVEGRKLFAHSAIIRCRSIVLAKMLDPDVLGRTRCVRITDASFKVFDCFLRYLYTAKLKNKSWNTMYNLYRLAYKYAVSVLKTICSRWLGMNLKVGSVSKCLALADLHADIELKEESIKFIRNHLSDILDTSDWKHLVSTHPQLASETLSFVTSPV